MEFIDLLAFDMHIPEGEYYCRVPVDGSWGWIEGDDKAGVKILI